MTLKLVILNNPGKPAVEMYDGKEYEIKTGENVLIEVIAKHFVSTRHGYNILPSISTEQSICPTCKQRVKQNPAVEEVKSSGATSETLPSTVQKPEEPQTKPTVKEQLEKLTKEELFELCKKSNIKVDGRTSETILREKLAATIQ